MRQLVDSRTHLGSAFAIMWSVGLWAIMWLSISPGTPENMLNLASPLAIAQGLRVALPLIAAVSTATFIVVKVIHRSPRGFGFFGPLGLLTTYGLVGLASSTMNSPNIVVALWWGLLYLSVPIVLWRVMWSPSPLSELGRLVNQTWLIMIMAIIILSVAAALYLDLVHKIFNPTLLLQCEKANWVDLTGGIVRGTGVGRYAAIAGIIAIGGVWQKRWPAVWGLVLIVSMVLLLYTGARGSFIGFFAGASLVLLIYLVFAGKQVIVAALLISLVLLFAILGTGSHSTFVRECLLLDLSPSYVVLEASEPIVSALNLFAGSSTQSSDEDGAEKEKVVIKSEAPSGTAVAPKSEAPPGTAVAPKSEAPPGTAVAPKSGSSNPKSPPPEKPPNREEAAQVAERFFTFSGRTAVWTEGWGLIKDSPLIGFGFQADRLLLGTHMHNSVLHALLQAGFLGAIPFVAAIIYGWFLFLRLVRKHAVLAIAHKHMVIQCGGVLAFLSMRALPESTGAFFGVDWLILALILLYLQVVEYVRKHPDEEATNLNIKRG